MPDRGSRFKNFLVFRWIPRLKQGFRLGSGHEESLPLLAGGMTLASGGGQFAQ